MTYVMARYLLNDRAPRFRTGMSPAPEAGGLSRSPSARKNQKGPGVLSETGALEVIQFLRLRLKSPCACGYRPNWRAAVLATYLLVFFRRNG